MASLAQEHIDDYKASDEFERDVILYLQEYRTEHLRHKPRKYNAFDEVIEELMVRK